MRPRVRAYLVVNISSCTICFAAISDKRINVLRVSDERRLFFCKSDCYVAFSGLTLLVGRQEGHPACKNRVMGCWRGYLPGAKCRLAYGPADSTATHCLLLQ